jgi:hypothetical protein
VKTATKSLSSRQVKKCRRELRWSELTLARLEVQRVELGLAHPELIRQLALLREQLKVLRSALAQIDPRTEADMPCPE